MSTANRQHLGLAQRIATFPGRYVAGHIALVLVLLFVPSVLNSDSKLQILNLALIYGIAALGLNIIFGLGGLLSIAQGAVMGVGGYTLVFAMAGTVGVVPALLLACAGGAILSGLTGLAAIRIRSHYFILLTLALAEAGTLLVQNNPDLTGGSNGMPLEGSPRIFGWDLTTANGLYYCAMPALIASWYLADCFKRSRRGLALRTLSADEYLAMMAGVATGQARFYATLIGGAFAGLAGGLLVVDDAYIGPQNFDLDTASLLLLIIVLGGPGSNVGTVVAAVILSILVQGTIMFTTLGQLAYGAAIIVLIVVAPGGLAGLARLLLAKASQRAAPTAGRSPHRPP